MCQRVKVKRDVFQVRERLTETDVPNIKDEGVLKSSVNPVSVETGTQTLKTLESV